MSNQVLLEGGASSSNTSWRHKELENLIDCLPYFDRELEDEATKARVKALIHDEMKRSSRKPSDFLKTLPPLPSLGFESCPSFGKEVERVRDGRPPNAFPVRQYVVEDPPESKKNDPEAWKASVEQAQIVLQYQLLNIENLELLHQYGPNSHLLHVEHLEAVEKRFDSLIEDAKKKKEVLNRDRLLNQQAAAEELLKVDSEWKQLIEKNAHIEAACLALELEIDSLKAQGLGASAQGNENDMEE